MEAGSPCSHVTYLLTDLDRGRGFTSPVRGRASGFISPNLERWGWGERLFSENLGDLQEGEWQSGWRSSPRPGCHIHRQTDFLSCRHSTLPGWRINQLPANTCFPRKTGLSLFCNVPPKHRCLGQVQDQCAVFGATHGWGAGPGAPVCRAASLLLAERLPCPRSGFLASRRENQLKLSHDWLCYLAPEIVREMTPGKDEDQLPFSKAADVYAFG